MGDDDDRQLAYVAAMLAELARWAENELAGGIPPKYIAQQMIAAVRYIRVLVLQARS